MNYHSRLPVVSVRTTGALGDINSGLAAAQDPVKVGPLVPLFTQLIPGGLSAQEAAAVVAAVDEYGKSESGNYSLEYPADIKLYGLSFNTVLGASGWALQGELSHRRNAPLQRAERTIFSEGLNPMLTALGLASNPTALGQFLAAYPPSEIQGYIRRNVSQVQATATKVLGPVLNSDSTVFVAEAALMHVHGMPDEPIESPAGGILATEEADADANSWGYRIATRLEYNNAIGSVNLYPYSQFLHDVSGNSPAPFGPFVEGRTGLTLGVGADYLSNWEADLSYTRFAGDGNELSDRDFVSASIKYSF